jgi:Ser/Thr protein kinase RdoA (MazF antagonist)
VLKNVLAAPEGLTLIDWTGAGCGPRVTSLATLLWSVAVGPGGVHLPAIDPVVGAYRAHVTPEPGELDRLGAALHVRLLWLACWMFALAVSSGQAPTGREWWWPDADLASAVAGRARAAFAAPP